MKKQLLDFYANWCGPCKVMSKYIDEFSKLHPEIDIVKMNVDDSEDMCEKFNILNLPTLIYFEDNQEKWRHTGLLTAKQLENRL